MEENWLQIWEKSKIPVILGLVGLILVGIGVFSVLLIQQKEPEIEILPADSAGGSVEESTIFVDMEGAVENPGVYEIPANSRISDLLVRAGGLSAQADREWVSKNINLAQKLSDGVKIYIPSQKEIRQFGGPALSTGGQSLPADWRVAGVSGSVVGQININTASAAQLDTLWGIGEKRARAIIDNRPYQTIEELLNRKIIPSNVYEKIKDEITVY